MVMITELSPTPFVPVAHRPNILELSPIRPTMGILAMAGRSEVLEKTESGADHSSRRSQRLGSLSNRCAIAKCDTPTAPAKL